MNITVIGQVAAGKSKLAMEVAALLKGYKYYDLDKEVEKELGMTLSEMMQKYPKGETEKFFKQTYARLKKEKNAIIATGAFFGTYHDFEEEEDVLFLNVSKKIFLERIAKARTEQDKPENKNRAPIFKKTPQELSKSYDDRKEKYLNKSTIVVNVSTKEEEERVFTIVAEMIERMEKEEELTKTNTKNNTVKNQK